MIGNRLTSVVHRGRRGFAWLVLCIASTASGQCFITELRASDSAIGDQFGDDVAVSGSVAVIGASRNDDMGGNSGAAYVFRYDDGIKQWIQEKKLLPLDGADSDLFGWSVDVQEDSAGGDVVVVGAYLDDDAGSKSGSAYVFRHHPGLWQQEAKLVAFDGGADDEFGQAVAISGTVIVVGSARDDDGGSNAGAGYVYRYDGNNWVFEQKLIASDCADQDRFGTAVDVDGDVIVIGSVYDDDSGMNSGAAYVFRYDGNSTWLEEEKLTAFDGAPYDQFGQAVAVDGDLIAVGAYLDDFGASNTGSAYIFRFDGSVWWCEARLGADNATADAQFGCAVAVQADNVEGDSVLIGAPVGNGAAIDSGSAYLFRFDGVDWLLESAVVGTDSASGDQFAWSVDIEGEWTFVGADKHDHFADNDGSVYVFHGLSECVDCNENAVSDAQDIVDGISEDCNENGVPDECEIDEESEAPGGPFFCTTDCDPDCNVNGIPDECDIADATSEDCNENDVPDECDIADGISEDCNGNGVPDECEIDENSNAPGGPFYCTEDCDPDCNVNGIPDECDISDGIDPDCNDNGIPDSCDIAAHTSQDLNSNGVPDECEDCNQNGFPDFLDVHYGLSDDCNENGVPDECEIDEDSNAPGGPFYCTDDCDPDCNNNGIPDECDIGSGFSEDLDENGVPDECDPDCNENGIPDFLDIDQGTSNDLNHNGIPDECEDCNENGVPDDLDISSTTSEDCNVNGIPDECEIDENSDAPGGPFFCTQDCDPDCNVNGIPDQCDIGSGFSMDLNMNGVPDECDPDCNQNGLPDFLDILYGFSEDMNANGIPDECECPADCFPDNGDGTYGEGKVNIEDLFAIIAHWGQADGPWDVNLSGKVDLEDLFIVLAHWGPCPSS